MEREKILIVEDDPQMAQALEAELSRAHDTVVVGTGAAALQQASAVDFDLIILDLNLPDIDGLDVAAELRDNPSSVLMLTPEPICVARSRG